MSAPDRRARLDRDHSGLSIRRQCRLLSVARSSVYCLPPAANDDDLLTMRLIDELFTAWPFLGSRRLAFMLRDKGHWIGRKRVQRLMRKMGIAALGPKPRTDQAAAWAQDFPVSPAEPGYRATEPGLGGRHNLHSDRARVPLPRGGDRLASRAVLAWRLSNTMDVSFCVSALEEAMARFGRPEIFNTDQGSQFTSAAFTGTLAASGIKISMDGRGRWMDNVFIERLWRSLKYEDIYLKGYVDGREAKAGIASWMAFYNLHRPHQALANRTPMAVWRDGTTGGLHGQAVDMTLALRASLDNAVALPTSPQPPQQQQDLVA